MISALTLAADTIKRQHVEAVEEILRTAVAKYGLARCSVEYEIAPMVSRVLVDGHLFNEVTTTSKENVKGDVVFTTQWWSPQMPP